MDNRQKILDALNALDPSLLNYQEWTEVGMALKTEGFPASVWEDWSSKDSSRYHRGECTKKYDSFNGAGVGGGTIIHYAERYAGYSPRGRVWSWDDHLPAEVEVYEETIVNSAPKKEKPYQMAIKYLETIYEPDDIVGYVHSAVWKEERNKWIPANKGIWRRQGDIVADLKRSKKFDRAFGSMNDQAGAWIRINPLDGRGAADKNVASYKYALVEADSMPLEEQKKLLINLKLPIACMVDSAGKSIHAVVKVDAQNESEYKQRVKFLYDELAKRGYVVDSQNGNPSRLSRLPGAVRGDRVQELIAVNIGCPSWIDWVDHLAGIDDDLPPFSNFWDQLQNAPSLSPELIAGVLREGNKMIITGESKAGKTCLSQGLACSIAEGKPWLGKFQCEQGKVLYINLEVEEASLFNRFENIYKANEWKFTKKSCQNIVTWNLRGKAVPLDKLSAKIIRRCRDQHFKAIILDPLYKVQQGDENSAEAIIRFCNALDTIAHETGAAVIYDHHHPKGASGDKKIIDRGSGSGVFSRDADAICDLSFLSPSKESLEIIGANVLSGEKPMQISFILRDFKDIEPINMWFKFPVHYIDSAGLLNGAPLEGSKEANLNKSSKRTSDDEKYIALVEAFNQCVDPKTQSASIKEMADFTLGHPSRRSLERYVLRFNDEFTLENGVVRRVKK